MTTWSAYLYELFGVPPETYNPGNHDAFAQLLHPNDRERALKLLRDGLAEGEPFALEYRILRPDGVERHIDVRCLVECGEDGKPTRLRGTARDVTERKRSEEALGASEQRYRSLIDNLSSGVVVHRLDTSIALSNPMASTLLGLTPEQLQGKTATDPRWHFLHENGSSMAVADFPVNRVMSTGAGFDSQVVGICRPDHSEPTWVLCSAYPVKDANGVVAHAARPRRW